MSAVSLACERSAAAVASRGEHGYDLSSSIEEKGGKPMSKVCRILAQNIVHDAVGAYAAKAETARASITITTLNSLGGKNVDRVSSSQVDACLAIHSQRSWAQGIFTSRVLPSIYLRNRFSAEAAARR